MVKTPPNLVMGTWLFMYPYFMLCFVNICEGWFIWCGKIYWLTRFLFVNILMFWNNLEMGVKLNHKDEGKVKRTKRGVEASIVESCVEWPFFTCLNASLVDLFRNLKQVLSTKPKRIWEKNPKKYIIKKINKYIYNQVWALWIKNNPWDKEIKIVWIRRGGDHTRTPLDLIQM